MLTLVFGSVLPWLLIAVGTWLGFQLLRQNGRILLRLESIEERLAAGKGSPTKPREPAGLPIGGIAPDFELPNLAGVRHKLSEFRGQDLLLIFFNPKCGFCTKMAADLADLSTDGKGQAVPIVVTTGDASENRQLVEQYGIRCVVLLQEKMEVASQYHAQGTPMGYRIDAAGRIASELAVGADALLKLVTTLPPQGKPAAKVNGHAGKNYQPDPSLARSKLNRSGLRPAR